MVENTKAVLQFKQRTAPSVPKCGTPNRKPKRQNTLPITYQHEIAQIRNETAQI